MGIGSLSYGQITTAMYLKVSVSDFLTLFSARTHDGFFWSSTPSPILLSAACFSLLISTILACFWPKSVVDDQDVEGLAYNAPYLAIIVWLYCILWWFVQDVSKVVAYYFMEKYNILGINGSTMVSKEDGRRNSNDDDCESLKTKLLG